MSGGRTSANSSRSRASLRVSRRDGTRGPSCVRAMPDSHRIWAKLNARSNVVCATTSACASAQLDAAFRSTTRCPQRCPPTNRRQRRQGPATHVSVPIRSLGQRRTGALQRFAMLHPVDRADGPLLAAQDRPPQSTLLPRAGTNALPPRFGRQPRGASDKREASVGDSMDEVVEHPGRAHARLARDTRPAAPQGTNRSRFFSGRAGSFHA
jgi:hypothetical protein